MALTIRALFRSSLSFQLCKPVRRWNTGQIYPLKIVTSGTCYGIPLQKQHNIDILTRLDCSNVRIRQFATQKSNDTDKPPNEVKKVGLIQKFKEMYRDYWYVLLPVHFVTSSLWFGGSYYAVISGVDVISLLESAGVSESIINPLRDSKAGYFALAFACYKMVTPLRYAVTVGLTTFTIRRLTAIGWLKPVPSGKRIKEMIQEKRDNLQDRYQEQKQNFQDRYQTNKQNRQDLYNIKKQPMQVQSKDQVENGKNKVKKM